MSYDQGNKVKLKNTSKRLIFSFPYSGIHDLNGLHEVDLKTLFYHEAVTTQYRQKS